MAKLVKNEPPKKVMNAARIRRNIVLGVGAVVLVVLIFLIASLIKNRNKVQYFADIEVQNYGTITLELDADAAPVTVKNFVDLAESGFYDGLTFHRIIPGFMIQGGDPNGNGTGGSGKNIIGEFTKNGHKNDLTHTRGALSMARSMDYNSASSQFFIVHEDSPHLDGQYAVFGYVTSGMDMVDAICSDAKPVDNNGTIPAENQPVINAVKIRAAD